MALIDSFSQLTFEFRNSGNSACGVKIKESGGDFLSASQFDWIRKEFLSIWRVFLSQGPVHT
jgi:hypothetical protein